MNLFPSTRGGIELFDEFFDSGLEESISPFLRPQARKWGVSLHLKASSLAAFLLFFAFLLTFFPGQKPLSNFFLLLTYFFAGIPALIASVEDVVNLEINIDVLMTMAAFLSVLIGSGMEGGLLLVLFSFSGAMEEGVTVRAKSAITALKKLSPQMAYVVDDRGALRAKSVKDITVGAQIHVKAGEIVPLDGRVVEGASSLNLVHLTGESLPVPCLKGDEAPAGARNLEGGLTLEVTHTSSDSTLARIIQLITQAQEAKPKLQRWLDKMSHSYAIGIIALTCLFALALPLFFSIPFLGKEGSVYRALAFLIAASPCALIIAIPIAYLSALSACAKNGVVLKGGVILDALAKCTTIAFDKTGTLTTGELACLGMVSFGEEAKALELAYTLERSAMHPIAHAIVAYAQERGITPLPISEFSQVAGFGLQALYENEPVFIGHAGWIIPQIMPELAQKVETQIESLRAQGEMVTLLLYRGRVTIFRFKDRLRSNIANLAVQLRDQQNLRLIMLTGDHAKTAQAIANEAGITEYYAELKPEDKLKFISKLDNLAMVGDGINDAPALARATVGISMGKVGSSTAIDASDIVLLQDNIEVLSWLIKKSHQVVRIVKQNVLFAAAAIIFATIPALLGWIPLWLAVVLHEGGTVAVGLNALRLLKGENHYGIGANAAAVETHEGGASRRD